jgi:hypothetical protein
MISVALIATLVAAPPARTDTHQRLHEHCLLQAADVTNPWALAHGMCAMGASFMAADGRLAAEVIAADFARPNLTFERYGSDGTPIEPHPALLTKTLVQAGMPLTRTFKTKSGPVTVGQLVKAVERDFVLPAPGADWGSVAWQIDVLSTVHKPGDTWAQADGGVMAIDAVMSAALEALERSNAELGAAMDKGLPQLQKRKQGIYAHPCGGLHFVQAVLSWARHSNVKKAWAARVDRQLSILMYRLDSERGQYDAALQQAPGLALQLLVQMLKFYGHFLETTGRLKREKIWVPSLRQKEAVMRATALLDSTVRQLDERKAFDSMSTLKTSQRQVYLDLIGDSCHAAHGLDEWRR